MSDQAFVGRDELGEYEWDNQRKDWVRPEVDRKVLKNLTERRTLNGLLRILYFAALLTVAAVATVLVARIHILLAIPVLYGYWFLYGFWVAIGHELQHKTVLAKSEDWLSEIIFYFVQIIMWNSPTYARVSHKLHHRYTMVRGFDPETDWPEVITSEWLKKHVRALILRMLVVGAVYDLGRAVKTQVERLIGKKDWMMRDFCTDEQNKAIRWESAMILAAHVAVVVVAIVLGVWWLFAFVTLAWHVGAAFERLWHDTKHIGRPYNVKDHRLNTRSVKVNWFIKSFFWGLDDHVDHHLYPAVPSKNLPRLHRILKPHLPEPDRVFGCWAEMFEIAKEKDKDARREFISIQSVPTGRRTPGPGTRGGAKAAAAGEASEGSIPPEEKV